MVASALLAAFLITGAALAADPPPRRPAPAQPVKAQNCGELPRGGKAYKDCLAAQARRDTTPQGDIKPVFSSR
jgi:hypothetical protein